MISNDHQMSEHELRTLRKRLQSERSRERLMERAVEAANRKKSLRLLKVTLAACLFVTVMFSIFCLAALGHITTGRAKDASALALTIFSIWYIFSDLHEKKK